MKTRGPQSSQSVPKAHVANLEPGPPLSPALRQSFVYTMAEECGGGGGETLRAPQSVPYAHIGDSEPGLPSLQSLSKVNTLVSKQKTDAGGGEVPRRT